MPHTEDILLRIQSLLAGAHPPSQDIVNMVVLEALAGLYQSQRANCNDIDARMDKMADDISKRLQSFEEQMNARVKAIEASVDRMDDEIKTIKPVVKAVTWAGGIMGGALLLLVINAIFHLVDLNLP